MLQHAMHMSKQSATHIPLLSALGATKPSKRQPHTPQGLFLYSLRQQAAYLLLLAAVELAWEGHIEFYDQVASAAWLLADGHALTPGQTSSSSSSSSGSRAQQQSIRRRSTKASH
jgi:hypothetical protein